MTNKRSWWCLRGPELLHSCSLHVPATKRTTVAHMHMEFVQDQWHAAIYIYIYIYVKNIHVMGEADYKKSAHSCPKRGRLIHVQKYLVKGICSWLLTF